MFFILIFNPIYFLILPGPGASLGRSRYPSQSTEKTLARLHHHLHAWCLGRDGDRYRKRGGQPKGGTYDLTPKKMSMIPDVPTVRYSDGGDPITWTRTRARLDIPSSEGLVASPNIDIKVPLCKSVCSYPHCSLH